MLPCSTRHCSQSRLYRNCDQINYFHTYCNFCSWLFERNIYTFPFIYSAIYSRGQLFGLRCAGSPGQWNRNPLPSNLLSRFGRNHKRVIPTLSRVISRIQMRRKNMDFKRAHCSYLCKCDRISRSYVSFFIL